MKCSDVLQCSGVLLCVWLCNGCMSGMLLLISVGYYCYAYVFVLLCYVCSVILL